MKENKINPCLIITFILISFFMVGCYENFLDILTKKKSKLPNARHIEQSLSDIRDNLEEAAKQKTNVHSEKRSFEYQEQEHTQESNQSSIQETDNGRGSLKYSEKEKSHYFKRSKEEHIDSFQQRN